MLFQSHDVTAGFFATALSNYPHLKRVASFRQEAPALYNWEKIKKWLLRFFFNFHVIFCCYILANTLQCYIYLTTAQSLMKNEICLDSKILACGYRVVTSFSSSMQDTVQSKHFCHFMGLVSPNLFSRWREIQKSK